MTYSYLFSKLKENISGDIPRHVIQFANPTQRDYPDGHAYAGAATQSNAAWVGFEGEGIGCHGLGRYEVCGGSLFEGLFFEGGIRGWCRVVHILKD